MSDLRNVENAIPNFELKDSYINLEISGEFKNFHEFYDASKDVIYEKIVELFKGLLNPENKSLTLTIYTIIDGFKWDSDIIISHESRAVVESVGTATVVSV